MLWQVKPTKEPSVDSLVGPIHLAANKIEAKPLYLSVLGLAEARYVLRVTRGQVQSHSGRLSMAKSVDGLRLEVRVEPNVRGTKYDLYSAPADLGLPFTTACAVESSGTLKEKFDADTTSGIVTIPMPTHSNTLLNVVAYGSDGSVWTYEPIRVSDAGQSEPASSGWSLFGFLFWTALFLCLIGLLIWLALQWRAGHRPIAKLLRPVRARLMPHSEDGLLTRARRESVNTELLEVGDCLYSPMLTAPLPPIHTAAEPLRNTSSTSASCGQSNGRFANPTHFGSPSLGGGRSSDDSELTLTPIEMTPASGAPRGSLDGAV